jgi:hypothetical protein
LVFVSNAYRDSLADPDNGVVPALAELYNSWRGAMV